MRRVFALGAHTVRAPGPPLHARASQVHVLSDSLASPHGLSADAARATWTTNQGVFRDDSMSLHSQGGVSEGAFASPQPVTTVAHALDAPLRVAGRRAFSSVASDIAADTPSASSLRSSSCELPATSSEYRPTPPHALDETLCARMDARWEHLRLRWLVTGSMDEDAAVEASDGTARAAAGGVASSASASSPAAATLRKASGPSWRVRYVQPDLSEEEVANLTARLTALRKARRRRTVRVNAAAIANGLRDPSRNIVLTRALPLPQMVDIVSTLWYEQAASPQEPVVPAVGGAIPAPAIARPSA